MVCVVDKPHNSFATFRHVEGGARTYAIIANKSGFAKVGIHLLEKRFDLNLIIVDRKASRWACERPAFQLELDDNVEAQL